MLHNPVVARDLVAGASNIALKQQWRVCKVEVGQEATLLVVPAAQTEVGAEAVRSAAGVCASARLKNSSFNIFSTKLILNPPEEK